MAEKKSLSQDLSPCLFPAGNGPVPPADGASRHNAPPAGKQGGPGGIGRQSGFVEGTVVWSAHADTPGIRVAGDAGCLDGKIRRGAGLIQVQRPLECVIFPTLRALHLTTKRTAAPENLYRQSGQKGGGLGHIFPNTGPPMPYISDKTPERTARRTCDQQTTGAFQGLLLAVLCSGHAQSLGQSGLIQAQRP